MSQAVTVAGSSDDDGTWVASDSQLVHEESLDVDPSEAEVRLQERQAALLNRKHHLLSQVSYMNHIIYCTWNLTIKTIHQAIINFVYEQQWAYFCGWGIYRVGKGIQKLNSSRTVGPYKVV